jgi:hypothetical protein
LLGRDVERVGILLEAAQLSPRRQRAKKFCHQIFILVTKTDSPTSVVAHFLSFDKVARPSSFGDCEISVAPVNDGIGQSPQSDSGKCCTLWAIDFGVRRCIFNSLDQTWEFAILSPARAY